MINNFSGVLHYFNPPSRLIPVRLQNLADSQNFNLLQLAAELGNIKVINFLINLDLFVDHPCGPFTCYSSDMQHAELIVRVPHLLMMYHNNPERLQDTKANFHNLFDYFEHKVIPELQEAIPKVQKKAKKDQKKKDKIIKMLVYTIILIMILFFIYMMF